MTDLQIGDASAPKPSRLSAFAARFIGVDRDTLNECPPSDRGNIAAIGILMALVWIYQSAVLSILGQQVLVPDGDITPGIVFGAITIATLIQQIDAYVFVRAGFYAEGLAELKRGGLDLTPGFAAKMRAAFFLILRILLSLGFAALTAIFTGLVIFKTDLNADFDRRFQVANGRLIATARAHVDAEIDRTAEASKAADAHLNALRKQVATMRNGAVNPAATDSSLAAAQEEIERLTAVKKRRDDELVSAQTYAADELAGVKSAPSNSGVRGRGPVRIAAEERLKAAEGNAASADRALQSAWARLRELRAQNPSSGDDRSRSAKAELPQLESDLQAASAAASTMRVDLETLTARRNDAIRAEVASAPDCVDCDRGLVGQLEALERISQDREIAAVVILIDVAAFGLELAAVFARVTVFLPTTYAALLARNTYLRLIEIVDGMDDVLNRPRTSDDDEDILPPLHQPATEHESATVVNLAGEPAAHMEPHFSIGLHPGTPPKRPRGRPRKSDAS